MTAPTNSAPTGQDQDLPDGEGAGGSPTGPHGQTQGADGSPEGDAPLAPRDVKWRERARELDGELTKARSRIETMQAAEVHRLGAAYLSEPRDLYLYAAPTDFLDDDGNVSAEKVKEIADEILEARPGLAVQPPPRHANFGQGTGFGRQGAAVKGATWDDVLKPAG